MRIKKCTCVKFYSKHLHTRLNKVLRATTKEFMEDDSVSGYKAAQIDRNAYMF